MRNVELSKWVYGKGIEWSQQIDTVDEDITAEEYIKACEANMDEPWWADRDSVTDYMIAIEDGYETLSEAWVNETLGE